MQNNTETEQQAIDRFDYTQYKSNVVLKKEYTHSLPFVKI